MRRFFTLAWLSYKSRQSIFRLDEFLCLETIYPLLTLIFYCVLASYSYNTDNLTRWVVGNSFLLCVNTCIFTLGSTFMAERAYGCIRSLVAAPEGKLLIILHKGLFTCITAVVTVTFGFFAGSLLFQVNFSQINLLLFFTAVIVAMFAAAGFGLFIGIFGLITDQMHFVLNFISYILMIFCGANFPISQLPIAGRLISRLIPLTRSIEAVNMLFSGVIIEKFVMLLLQEAGIGAGYYFLSWLLIKGIEKTARRKGTLEVF
ncbi:ABC transporter permease [Anaerocolumna sp. AGMB13020]|uniref:ABC transporter permease n=1 Tax=Anaerocolumna sp. AGMB13020 TaxID=3081750 RepID=UPI0029548060|nr:ABC transporter permease [Anaerocolumna sp. AGMB13020]WOO38789.1 ABC transporter permease [Anaerocolumna sp. AGMB13020]